MKNKEISLIFNQIADLMEIKGENRFRINSYRKAGRILEETAKDVEELSKNGKLEELPGIGESMHEKINQYIKEGVITRHQELLKTVPSTLLDLLKVPHLGPKGVKKLYEELDIKGVADLKKKIENGELDDVKGYGKKKSESIKKGIEFLEKTKGRIKLNVATKAAVMVIDMLEKKDEVKKIKFAGSLRRRKDSIGDVDILVGSEHGAKVIEDFTTADFISEVVAAGATKGTAMVSSGGRDVQVDVRVVPEESFGSALQYFTGSKQHNVRLREIAVKNKWKLNEYGLFEDNKLIAGEKEEDIYFKLGLQFIDPRLREDRGEIEAARENKLPRLVQYSDIKGNLHVHTTDSDGRNSLREIIEAAIENGFEYLCINDHSKSQTIANGLSVEKIKKQINQIYKLNDEYDEITVFSGSEVDIMSDGSLDYEDEILKDLDFVIASIHSGMEKSRQENTERILKAMDNKYVHCIGHLTGRRLNEREAMSLDIQRIVDHAAATNTILEINASPSRLDLKDMHCKSAIEKGVKLSVGTDAHDINELKAYHYGVDTAARGWAEKKDIVNTKTAKQFKKFCKGLKK